MGLGVTDSMVKVKKVLNRANKVCDQDWWSNRMGFGYAARGRMGQRMMRMMRI